MTTTTASLVRAKCYKLAKNPLTDRFEPAVYVFGHFGFGVDGIKFSNGTIYNPEMVAIKIKDV